MAITPNPPTLSSRVAAAAILLSFEDCAAGRNLVGRLSMLQQTGNGRRHAFGVWMSISHRGGKLANSPLSKGLWLGSSPASRENNGHTSKLFRG